MSREKAKKKAALATMQAPMISTFAHNDRDRWLKACVRMSGRRKIVMMTTTMPMPKSTQSWNFLLLSTIMLLWAALSRDVLLSL